MVTGITAMKLAVMRVHADVKTKHSRLAPYLLLRHTNNLMIIYLWLIYWLN